MKKYDLIVAGGGFAGVAAAVSAQREGLNVLLIEKAGCLGGAVSTSLVYPFMCYHIIKTGRLLSDGIFTEMRNRFDEYNEASYEAFKFVFDDMVTESGADILFHSSVIKVNSEGRNIKSVSVSTKSGVVDIEADFFIDATGDGELIYLSGCDYQLGRESDSLCQPMTTCFRMCNADVELFKKEKPALEEKYKELQKNGEIRNPRENILTFYGLGEGVIHFNTTRVVKYDPTDPVEISRAEVEARKQVYEMIKFLKENSKAFDKSTLVSIANHIGVRESRKLKGVHILTSEEMKDCTVFEDTIALGNYDIDIHNPEGTGTYIYRFENGTYYRIPYRSLLPKEYDNMLVAGRCLSATHEAHSAVRIMAICASLGEAAGTALAIAHKTSTNAHTVDVQAVRDRLREKGAAVD